MENRKVLKVCDMVVGHGEKILCRNVSFEIHEGECIMLCGANGSGKTTLMKALAGMNGTSRHEIAMIPARIPKVKGFTLREFIRISCYRHSDASGRLSTTDERRIDETIRRLGLSQLDSRDISTLSDGEFQKACISAALIRKARLILLDEPTAFLDAESRISVLETLRKLTRTSDEGRRRSVLFSTHDLHEGLKVADRVFAIGSDGLFHVSKDEDASRRATVTTIFRDI